ncbi:hypothetical protein CUT44_05490 [Streptomyces carminius]|uniref:Uncharacterized protein n=1 Tax=Streptomyces carminius TaxID=2665496 RepID=A0A2M8M4U7_9ACTN|nr:hypothetical protein CUT44_05490 [Streptomyces carminius]
MASCRSSSFFFASLYRSLVSTRSSAGIASTFGAPRTLASRLGMALRTVARPAPAAFRWMLACSV